jgi:hypothetical protein
VKKEADYMSVAFEYNLDEIVNFDNKNISLRRALREYVATKKKLMGGLPLPPMWHRDPGRVPSFFDIHHMDELAGSVRAEDLNASNDE